jgi:putative tryptophan/tyrosine transport system substrate-binding protein
VIGNRRELLILLGGAMTAASALRSQQKAKSVIGFLNPTSAGPLAPFVAAFRQGLSETSYVEGQNIAIEYRWAEGHTDRLPALAADLVSRKVDGHRPAEPLRRWQRKMRPRRPPIVFVIGSDPVIDGLVASLARPGSNLTGFTLLGDELTPKRLELVPQARRIALLVNPNYPEAEPLISDMQKAAQAKGVQLHILKVGTESEIDAAFSALAEVQVEAFLVSANPFFDTQREQLVALASRRAVPAIYSEREFAAAGGLISYGTSRTAAYRQAGIYVGKILYVAKPADLPVQQPTTFELVVNLRTAKALGLTVPPSILARADEVIE